MPVTQLVTANGNLKALHDSLKQLSTGKIVFVTRKEKLAETVIVRQEIALQYKLPTEVLVMENYDESKLKETVQKYDNPVLHVIETGKPSFLLTRLFTELGLPVYETNGSNKLEQVNTAQTE